MKSKFMIALTGLLFLIPSVACALFPTASPTPATPTHYSDSRGVQTPTPTAPTSVQAPPVPPTTPPPPQSSEAGTGTVFGDFPETSAEETVSLKLLALSEDFHPYEACGMDCDEGVRLLLEENQLVATMEAQGDYRFDRVPAGVSLLLFAWLRPEEDPSKPTGWAVGGFTACGPFALYPGQKIQIPWISGCWGPGGFPGDWPCPQDPESYSTAGPAKITGVYTGSWTDQELAIYALSSDFSPYDLCHYQDYLGAMSRSNELAQRVPLTPRTAFSVEGVPSGKPLLLVDVAGGVEAGWSLLGQFPLVLLPGQTLDLGEVAGTETWLFASFCAHPLPLDYAWYGWYPEPWAAVIGPHD